MQRVKHACNYEPRDDCAAILEITMASHSFAARTVLLHAAHPGSIVL